MKKKNVHTNGKIVRFILNFGSIVGLLVGFITVIDWLENRDPNLDLFIPQQYSGIDQGCEERYYAILTYITNSSKRSAYLLPVTLAVELEIGGKWHKTTIGWMLKREFIETDFTNLEKIRHGTEDVKILRRHDNPVVTRDNPMQRYIIVQNRDKTRIENVSKVRIKIRDCHMKLYDMCVDLKEQKKYEPT